MLGLRSWDISLRRMVEIIGECPDLMNHVSVFLSALSRSCHTSHEIWHCAQDKLCVLCSSSGAGVGASC